MGRLLLRNKQQQPLSRRGFHRCMVADVTTCAEQDEWSMERIPVVSVSLRRSHVHNHPLPHPNGSYMPRLGTLNSQVHGPIVPYASLNSNFRRSINFDYIGSQGPCDPLYQKSSFRFRLVCLILLNVVDVQGLTHSSIRWTPGSELWQLLSLRIAKSKTRLAYFGLYGAISIV